MDAKKNDETMGGFTGWSYTYKDNGKDEPTREFIKVNSDGDGKVKYYVNGKLDHEFKDITEYKSWLKKMFLRKNEKCGNVTKEDISYFPTFGDLFDEFVGDRTSLFGSQIKQLKKLFEDVANTEIEPWDWLSTNNMFPKKWLKNPFKLIGKITFDELVPLLQRHAEMYAAKASSKEVPHDKFLENSKVFASTIVADVFKNIGIDDISLELQCRGFLEKYFEKMPYDVGALSNKPKEKKQEPEKEEQEPEKKKLEGNEESCSDVKWAEPSIGETVELEKDGDTKVTITLSQLSKIVNDAVKNAVNDMVKDAK